MHTIWFSSRFALRRLRVGFETARSRTLFWISQSSSQSAHET